MSRRPLTGVATTGEPAFIIRGSSFDNDPRPATALPHVNGNGRASDPLSRAQRIAGDPLAQRRQRAAVAALVSPPKAPRSHPGASRAAAPRPWSLSPASPGGRTADAAGVRAELLATRRSLNEALDDLRTARTAASGGDAALHRELADERRRRAELEADVARLRAVVDTQRDDAATSFQAFAAADAAAQRELEFVKEAEEAKREQQAKALEGGIKAQQRAVAAAVKDAKAELRRQFAIEKEELRRSLNETHEAALEAARRSR